MHKVYQKVYQALRGEENISGENGGGGGRFTRPPPPS